MKTIQLRRYALNPGASNDFVAWWQKVIPPLRGKFGFIIEWAYLDASVGEFVWAVSLPGDALEFENVEAAYLSSPERARAFADRPDWVSNVHVALVREVYVSSALDHTDAAS